MLRMTRLALALFAATVLFAQSNSSTVAGSLKSNFDYVNRKLLAMAENFPADKYGFRLKPEMRSFAAVVVHVASGNVYAAKAGKGDNVQWDELDASKYKSKDACVALLKKSIADAKAAIAINPEGPKKNLEPFLSVLQHGSEHYGLLVAYYRANGLVPPEVKSKE